MFVPSDCATLYSHQQWVEAIIAVFSDIVCSGMLAVLMTARYLWYLFLGFYLLWQMMETFFFICLFAIWTFATGEVSVQIFCPHFNCVWCLLILEFYEIFVSFGYWSFIRYVFCKCFFFLVCNLFLCVLSFFFFVSFSLKGVVTMFSFTNHALDVLMEKPPSQSRPSKF